MDLKIIFIDKPAFFALFDKVIEHLKETDEKPLKTLFATLFFVILCASCDQSDVDDLTITDVASKTKEIDGTGGGAGGDPK